MNQPIQTEAVLAARLTSSACVAAGLTDEAIIRQAQATAIGDYYATHVAPITTIMGTKGVAGTVATKPLAKQVS